MPSGASSVKNGIRRTYALLFFMISVSERCCRSDILGADQIYETRQHQTVQYQQMISKASVKSINSIDERSTNDEGREPLQQPPSGGGIRLSLHRPDKRSDLQEGTGFAWRREKRLLVTDTVVDGKDLESIRAAFDSHTLFNVTCWRDDYAGSRDDFLVDKYSALLGPKPVLVYPMCLNLFQLGNTLGYYLNDVACAASSGAHFVGVSDRFVIPNSDVESLSSPPSARYAFFAALPTAILHPSPSQPEQVKNLMNDNCSCLQYCWEHPSAPWLQNIAMIGQVRSSN
jgi:hypothetical protein